MLTYSGLAQLQVAGILTSIFYRGFSIGWYFWEKIISTFFHYFQRAKQGASGVGGEDPQGTVHI
jgi:hypothetical protein